MTTRIATSPIAGPSADQTLKRSLGILGLWLGLTVISALTLIGCSSEPSPVALPAQPLHPVKGSVQTAEGKPLTEGIVTFVPTKLEARAATGKIQPDGSFAMKTGDSDGVAEGDYKVKIESNLTAPGAKPGQAKALVPIAYADEQSSQLAVTVKSGANDLQPFKLVPVTAKKAVIDRGSLRDVN